MGTIRERDEEVEPDGDGRETNVGNRLRVLGHQRDVLKHEASKRNEINMVAPTGFEPVFQP
jgi:hypothetical protein